MENLLSCLPEHGRVSCTLCYQGRGTSFDKTERVEGEWKITSNPLSWGNRNAEIVVLGFSKGPTQSGALASTPHDEIAYKGGRLAVGKILAHIGLIENGSSEVLKKTVDQIISDKHGRFHFGSLVRCTVQRLDGGTWKGSGGGMLDKFTAQPLGDEVAGNCSKRFLCNLPIQTKVVVMFGLGTKGNYVKSARSIIQRALPTQLKTINQVSYSNAQTTFVHVEHFASQGALLPNWLGENVHERAKLGILAKEAVSIRMSST